MKYMKYRKLIYYITMITLLMSPVIVATTKAPAAIIMGIAVVILIVTARLNKKQPERLVELINIYLDDCDPVEFINRAAAIADSRWAPKQEKYYLQVWIANALYDSGRKKEACTALQKINWEEAKTFFPFGDLTMASYEIAYFLWNQEICKAEDIYRRMCSTVQNDPSLKTNPEVMKKLKASEASIEYCKGTCEPFYDYYVADFNSSESSMRDKVTTAYILGTIDEARDKQKAEQYFSFAVHHGNKMDLVERAKAKLKNLQESRG